MVCAQYTLAFCADRGVLDGYSKTSVARTADDLGPWRVSFGIAYVVEARNML